MADRLETTFVLAVTNLPDARANQIHRTVELLPRQDGEPWSAGQKIALHQGVWSEARDGDAIVAQVTKIVERKEIVF